MLKFEEMFVMFGIKKYIVPLANTGDFISIEGKIYIYKGIRHNKHQLRKLLYTDSTYTEREIFQLERSLCSFNQRISNFYHAL